MTIAVLSFKWSAPGLPLHSEKAMKLDSKGEKWDKIMSVLTKDRAVLKMLMKKIFEKGLEGEIKALLTDDS